MDPLVQLEESPEAALGGDGGRRSVAVQRQHGEALPPPLDAYRRHAREGWGGRGQRSPEEPLGRLPAPLDPPPIARTQPRPRLQGRPIVQRAPDALVDDGSDSGRAGALEHGRMNLHRAVRQGAVYDPGALDGG